MNKNKTKTQKLQKDKDAETKSDLKYPFNLYSKVA